MQLFLKYLVMTPRSLKRGLTPFGGKFGKNIRTNKKKT